MDMEYIVNIKEEYDFKLKGYTQKFDGFFIETSRQTIKLGISNGQSCCEDFGYFMSLDDIEEFIGSQIFSIEIVNECLAKDKLRDIYEGGCMFVDINTTVGTLQFTAYNEHNGYYGHEAVVVSEQLNEEVSL